MNKKAMTVRDVGSADNLTDAHLWVCSGKNVGRRYQIGDVPQVLGRAGTCDIVVEDERASQRHARVQFAGGRHVIEDLGSTNGTFVNSQRVQQASLKNGDLLQVGETVYEYLTDEAALNATARGSGQDQDPVPDSLRSGAQQMLRRARGGPQYDPAGRELVPRGSHAPAYPSDGYPPQYPGVYDEEEEEEEEEGFDLVATLIRIRKIVGAYLPYWPLAASLLFIGVAVGALYHKYTPIPHTAAFQIVLRKTGTRDTLIPGTEGEDNVEFFGSQVGTRFLSAPVIEHAIKRVTGEVPNSKLVAITSKSLYFERIGLFRSNMYAGAFTAMKADYAVKYLNTHLRVFLDREVEMALSQVKADVGFFQSEVEKTAKTLEEAENALSDYKSSHPEALPTQIEAQYKALFNLQQKRAELERKMVALEASLREDQRQLGAADKYTKSGFQRVNHFAPLIAATEAKIAAARAQGKGDKHPDIIKLKKELAEFQQLEIDEGSRVGGAQIATNPLYQSLQQRIQSNKTLFRSMEQERIQVDRDLKRQKRKIETLPRTEAEYKELVRNHQATQTQYSALLNRLRNKELLLDRERARADAQYQIVVPPRLNPVDPAEGRVVRLAIGGVLGLVFAFLISTILAFRTGRLNLTLLIGREIDLSALFGDEPTDGLPSPSRPSSSPQRALEARSPLPPRQAQATNEAHGFANEGQSSPGMPEDETAIVDTRNVKPQR